MVRQAHHNSMFFLLSKLLHFIISPYTWILGLLIWAFFAKDPLRRKKLLKWGLILLLFFSNSFILDEFMRAWEVKVIANDEKLEYYDVGIVLGGISAYDGKIDRVQINRSGDRLIQAIRLYKQGKIGKILFAGGSGSILHEDIKEGVLIKELMLNLGVPDSVIIIENDSKNTYENAVETKKILSDGKHGTKFLLITSASHMNRAMACFIKQELKVTPYVTDRNSGDRKFEFDHLIIPNIDTLSSWNKLIHEWVGMVTYKLMGYC